MRHNRCILLAMFIILTICITPALADDGSVANNILGPLASAIIQAITKIITMGAEALFKPLMTWLAKFLAEVPRPASLDAVRDAWSTCFDIYITMLLPISLTILGIYIMFSSEPPSWVVLEGYVKRVVLATFMAYFSFTIIDTIVWLTNEISSIILSLFLSGADLAVVGTELTTLVATIVFGTVQAPVIAPFIVFFILTILAIIAGRLALIYLIAATMPIFSFFLIIGVGPLRKLSEFVEYLWGLGITLPILSILGALIVGLMVKLQPLSTIRDAGVMGIFITLGPLFLVLAFPSIVSSMMGTFGAASGLVHTFTKMTRGGLTSAAIAKSATALAMGGKLAPLYAMLPSKLAAGVHSAFEGALHRLEGIKGLGFIARGTYKIFPELKREPTLLEGSQVLAKVGTPLGALGTLYALAKRGGIDATRPEALSAFEDLSASVGKVALSGDKKALEKTLSTLYGTGGSLPILYRQMLRENLNLAKKVRDPGIIGLSALLATVDPRDPARSAEKIQKLFSENPEVRDAILNSRFARAFLSSIVGERELMRAMTGDYDAAWAVSEKLSSISAKIEPYNNTFRELVTGGDLESVANALIQDIHDTSRMGSDKIDEAIKVYAEASGLPEQRVRDVFNEVLSGNDKAVYDLAQHLLSDKGRALTVMGEQIATDSINVHIGEDEATKRISAFITSGGLVKTSVSPEEAEAMRKLQMYVAREKVRQAKIKDYLSERIHVYHKHFTRIDPITYDPEQLYIPDYKSVMRGLNSWVRETSERPRYIA